MFVIGTITEAASWLKEEYESSSLFHCGLITLRVNELDSGNGLVTICHEIINQTDEVVMT